MKLRGNHKFLSVDPHAHKLAYRHRQLVERPNENARCVIEQRRNAHYKHFKFIHFSFVLGVTTCFHSFFFFQSIDSSDRLCLFRSRDVSLSSSIFFMFDVYSLRCFYYYILISIGVLSHRLFLRFIRVSLGQSPIHSFHYFVFVAHQNAFRVFNVVNSPISRKHRLHFHKKERSQRRR